MLLGEGEQWDNSVSSLVYPSAFIYIRVDRSHPAVGGGKCRYPLITREGEGTPRKIIEKEVKGAGCRCSYEEAAVGRRWQTAAQQEASQQSSSVLDVSRKQDWWLESKLAYCLYRRAALIYPTVLVLATALSLSLSLQVYSVVAIKRSPLPLLSAHSAWHLHSRAFNGKAHLPSN